MAKVVGGAAGPHSPVVYELPWEESEEYTSSMDKLRNALMGIGRELRRLEVDTLLVFAADHVQTFWFGCFPQMMIFTGDEADYSVNGHKIMRIRSDHEMAEELLFKLVEEEFDVGFMQEVEFFDHPFTVPVYWILKGFGENNLKVLPFQLNTNVHPRVSPKRCYKLGQAVRKILEKSSKKNRIFVIGTGGLSHYPGTPYYGNVDEEADRWIINKLEKCEISRLAELDYEWLDATGNHELGTWIAAAAAVNPSSTEILMYWRPWNNGYCVARFNP
jgi:hypothetical protein